MRKSSDHRKPTIIRPEEAPVSGSAILWFFVIVICSVAVFAFVDYQLNLRRAKKLATAQSRAMLWKNALSTYRVLGLASLLIAMPFYLMARRRYRKERYGSHLCPYCGGKTHLLKGAEAASYLTPSRQFEVRLGSMEYDVHKCDKCGRTEIVAFPSDKTPYSTCPSCGAAPII